jgi:hypothetical protein
MTAKSEHISRWTPSSKFKENYDRIFAGKTQSGGGKVQEKQADFGKTLRKTSK